MKKLRVDKFSICATLGLGCFLACVLIALLGQFPFPDFAEARSCQIPLTLSGDLGCLVGLALCAIATKAQPDSEVIDGFAAAFASAGLCISYLIRSGFIAGFNTISLIAGDFLSGAFTIMCTVGWWRIIAPRGEHEAIKHLATALGIASALFLLLSVFPATIARIVACIVLPLSMCLCFLPLVNQRNNDRLASSEYASVAESRTNVCDSQPPRYAYVNPTTPATTPSQSLTSSPSTTVPTPIAPTLPRVVVLTIALSSFVVDLAMALFPVCLFHEESPLLAFLVGADSHLNTPLGTLTQPAAICAILIIVFAVVLFILGKRGNVPLAPLYYTGFAMTAFDYLAFPYHFSGGTPLAIAECGRIIIALFIVAMLLQLLENRGGNFMKIFLQAVSVAFIAMVAADILATIVQMQPGYDYADFQFRTVFAGIGTAVLVVLLLGPLPRVNAAIAPIPIPKDETTIEADSSLSLEERFEQACADFAADHRLSARESEVFVLIANGRDVPYIEHELVLAKSTVKTHIKHIYEKCGVSSRQDLLDMFEDYRR